jgi:hypothetical protein
LRREAICVKTRFHLFQRGPSFGPPWGSWDDREGEITFPSLSERTFFRTRHTDSGIANSCAVSISFREDLLSDVIS